MRGILIGLIMSAALISGIVTLVVCVKESYGLPEEPELRIVHVGGLYAVKPEQVQDIYKMASWYFQQVGITFRMQVYPLDYNPCIYKHGLQFRQDELECFKPMASTRKKVITFIMTPPFVTIKEAYGPHTTWIAGTSYRCKNLSTGNAEEVSIQDGVIGDEMLTASSVVLAHEVFHNLCAEHIDRKPNLMHSNALIYTLEYAGKIPVLGATKKQVKRWYVKRRKHGRK